jgi:hypothetical protein
MIKILDIKEGKIDLHPEVFLIPQLKELWTRDRTSTKKKGLAELAYVVFKNNPNKEKNPYLSYPIDTRIGILIKDLFKDEKWKPDGKVTEAEIKYIEFMNTQSLRLLNSSRKATDKLAEYFESIDFTLKDHEGKPLHSARDLTANLEKVGRIVESLSKLEEVVIKEQTKKTSARGNRDLGPRELPKI